MFGFVIVQECDGNVDTTDGVIYLSQSQADREYTRVITDHLSGQYDLDEIDQMIGDLAPRPDGLPNTIEDLYHELASCMDDMWHYLSIEIAPIKPASDAWEHRIGYQGTLYTISELQALRDESTDFAEISAITAALDLKAHHVVTDVNKHLSELNYIISRAVHEAESLSEHADYEYANLLSMLLWYRFRDSYFEGVHDVDRPMQRLHDTCILYEKMRGISDKLVKHLKQVEKMDWIKKTGGDYVTEFTVKIPAWDQVPKHTVWHRDHGWGFVTELIGKRSGFYVRYYYDGTMKEYRNRADVIWAIMPTQVKEQLPDD